MVPAAGRSLRRLLGCTSLVAAACIAAMPALAGPGAKPVLPDLVPELPDQPTKENGDVPAVWVDPIEHQGRVLYRFDAAVTNVGRGTMDVICDPCGGHSEIWQVLWPSGHPTGKPRPDSPPPAKIPRVLISDRGATMRYSPATGHVHWHLQKVARYELVLPGGEIVKSNKVGFCLYDSFHLGRERPTYFFGAPIPGTRYTWCATQHPEADFVRMGISPGLSDLYPGWLPSQWIDVTGLPPGRYRLRGIIDPEQRIVEARRDNNVIEVMRTIPGVRTDDQLLTTEPDAALTATLTATIVAPGIPARVDPACDGRTPDCFVSTTADGPLRFTIVRGPRHGALGPIEVVDGLTVRVAYQPAPGYSGQDSFSFQAVDERGLASRETRVAIGVGEPARALDVRSPALLAAADLPVAAEASPRHLLFCKLAGLATTGP